jgi:NAD+ synthase
MLMLARLVNLCTIRGQAVATQATEQRAAAILAPEERRVSLWIDPELTRHVLTQFIAEEIGKFGVRRGVVGVSGGIDSALVVALAAEALGPENVLAVLMPYRTSNPDSLAHGLLCVEQLGVQQTTIPVTPQVDPYFAQFPEMSPRRRGNIMARERMKILYDQSEGYGGLVIGTSNKTEMLLGYSTVYGDAAAAIHPIADLYKTQIRQLSAAVGVPEVIIGKPPSADLWPGQTDEDELQLTYAAVDEILYCLVDRRMRPAALIARGIPAEVVERVVRLVRAAQYKRRTPPIAKVSARTIEQDFLYLRDWGH